MNNIRKIREEKGITREKLAFMAGASVTAIQNYEKGKQSPTIGVALRIAKVLGVSLDELFEEEEESKDDDKWYYDPKKFDDHEFGGSDE